MATRYVRDVTLDSRRDVDGSTSRRYMLGVLIGTLREAQTIVAVNPIEATAIGAASTWGIVAQPVPTSAKSSRGRKSGDQIAGPIGIINVSGQVAHERARGPGPRLLVTRSRLLGWRSSVSPQCFR